MDIVTFSFDSSKVSVRADGLVGIEMGKLKCFSCKYDTAKCSHVQKFRRFTENESNVSCKKIPFNLTTELSEKLPVGYKSFLPIKDGVYLLIPKDTACKVCKAGLQEEILEGNVKSFTRTNMLRCHGKFSVLLPMRFT